MTNLRRIGTILRSAVTVLAVLLAIPMAPGFGASFAPKEFDQLVGEADEIFVGTASEASSRKLGTGAIVTDVTFRNLRVVKGNASAGETTIMVLGGTVGAETLALRGVPKFQVGITYLIFVQGNGSTIFPVVGGHQGLFQIRRDPASGRELVYNASGLAPTGVTLEDFLQAIRNRLGQ